MDKRRFGLSKITKMELSTPRILSIGRACSDVQALPDRVREVATRLGIDPVLTIDGRQYFAESDVEVIARIIHAERTSERIPNN